MNQEFLDFVEDILDAMEKAELLLEGVSYEKWDVVKKDIRMIKPLVQKVLSDYKE